MKAPQFLRNTLTIAGWRRSAEAIAACRAGAGPSSIAEGFDVSRELIVLRLSRVRRLERKSGHSDARDVWRQPSFRTLVLRARGAACVCCTGAFAGRRDEVARSPPLRAFAAAGRWRFSPRRSPVAPSRPSQHAARQASSSRSPDTGRRARGSSTTASRCRAAAANISSAGPTRSPGAPIIRPRTPTTRRSACASWYGDAFHGRRTANGEVYDMRSLSAAHPTMPLPSYARVTNLANGYSMIVRVNDRGPYSGGRIMDVSSRVADMLDYQVDRHGEGEGRIRRRGAARRRRRHDAGRQPAHRRRPGERSTAAGPTMVADAEPPEPPSNRCAPPPQPFAPRPMAVERPRDDGPPFVAAASPRLLKAPPPPPRPFDLGAIARVLHTASDAPLPPRRRPSARLGGRARALFRRPARRPACGAATTRSRELIGGDPR